LAKGDAATRKPIAAHRAAPQSVKAKPRLNVGFLLIDSSSRQNRAVARMHLSKFKPKISAVADFI
jgi:hypothetical protein